MDVSDNDSMMTATMTTMAATTTMAAVMTTPREQQQGEWLGKGGTTLTQRAREVTNTDTIDLQPK